MKRTSIAALVALVTACGSEPAHQSEAVATSSSTITFGQPDLDGHPNVGAIAFQPPGAPEGTRALLCTGTLIAGDVVLTAGHCTAFLQSSGVADVYVTFDPEPTLQSEFFHGTYVTHPDFACCGLSDLFDLAVVLLDTAVPGIAPAALAPAGLLDDMFDEKRLSSATFTAVGYGAVRNDKTKGPANILPAGKRRFAEQTFMSLTKAWLNLSMQPSTGDGGTCYGDSGGPHFLEVDGTDVIVSVTSRGDVPCRATDKSYRVDTPAALAFIEQFLD